MKTYNTQAFFEGHAIDTYTYFGCHKTAQGHLFRVYAPNAKEVFLIGDFNGWSNTHPMNCKNGIYELEVLGLSNYIIYKYRIMTYEGTVLDKSDPYAFYSELRPQTGSFVYDLNDIQWTDEKWMQNRTLCFDRPLHIYEVYAGGWKKHENGFYTFTELKEELLPYVIENGFTHIEMMPLTEFPFDGSWGYQTSGYFSLTSRYGNPHEFSDFVNTAHRMGIGIILDLAIVHFVKDAHGLQLFDGSKLYEYPNERDAYNEWGTLNFDLWKETTRSFLMSSIAFWCDIYHVDGIRFDAINNLIYWNGNKNKGINGGAIDFIKRLNYNIHQKFPTVMLMAEDSSDYPGVTSPYGLGFHYKWDLGWMNDTLKYYSIDPYYRKHHHHLMTFSMAYFYQENFILPLSHDEVVHGKKTIVDKMWGNYKQKFDQLKNLYVYLMTHPGKKLNFMGNELAMFREFDENRSLDWDILKFEQHQKFMDFFKKLNHIYNKYAALWQQDYMTSGFRWIDVDNDEQSIFSFYRESEKEIMLVILNMCPIYYEHYRIGVPKNGVYTCLLDTHWDLVYKLKSEKKPWHYCENSIEMTIKPFGAYIFRSIKRVKNKEEKE